MLPTNVTATTSVAEAIAGARYAVHALPVQHSRAFLTSIKVCACLVSNRRSTQLVTIGGALVMCTAKSSLLAMPLSKYAVL